MPGKNSGSKKIVERQRSVQAKVRKADERGGKSGAKKSAGDAAMQAGARRYPEPPFPKQHQPKPGAEAELDPAADVRRAVLSRLRASSTARWR